MAKSYKFLIPLCLILLIGLTNNVQSQVRIVDVPGGVGTLNDAIDGDTTATGERVDLNTIYRLERDGIYLLNGAIDNDGYPLTIEAAEGDGARPKLIPAVPTGGDSDRPFRPEGNLTLKGLYVTDEDELGAFNTRMIRVSAEGLTIIIDDCHLDKDGQSCFRLDDDGTKLFITNSIISNIGLPYNPNNGRVVDDRGNDIDTLVMHDNTFYNISSRVLRDGGGYINYADVVHNTYFNIGQFVMSFGEIIELNFRDNLVINGGFYGRNTNEVEGNSLAAANAQWFQLKDLGQDLLDAGNVQDVNFSNNNFYLDPAYSAVYPDSVEAIPVLDSLTAVWVELNGSGATNIEEAVTFTNVPAVQTEIITNFWVDPATAPAWDLTNLPFDFEYPTSAASYTASSEGLPLGALTWFDGVSGVEDGSEVIPSSFALYANYPNPFNPTTNISYTIPEQGQVRLTIYNMLGQVVTTLVNEVQNSGTYELTWNGKSEAGINVSTGVYIYQLSTSNFIATRKMMLLK